jgi:predicted amidohydrolase YtcJ
VSGVSGTSGASGAARDATRPADSALLNGVVYTADRGRGVAQAVAVGAGRIVAVGSDDDVRRVCDPSTRLIDLGGRLVLPGFIDSHAHASETVGDVFGVRLKGLASLQEYVAAVRAFAADHPELPAIRGWGWSNVVVPGRGPTAAALDAAVTDRPALLTSEDGHSLWANSPALRRVGLNAGTPDPANGVIERDPATGEPSGTLREGAQHLVLSATAPFTSAQCTEGIRHFQREVAGPLGITTVFDPMLVAGEPIFDAFERLQRDGELTVRYRAGLWLRSDLPVDEQLRAASAERDRHHGALFQADTVKLFADGVIEGHTAYLDEPYADTPGNRGFPEWPAAALNAASLAAAGAGFELHYHAIGDAGTALALDAIAAARAAGFHAGRPAITHVQLTRRGDIERFAQLGVTAVLNPYWFLKDDYFYDLQVPYLGPERAEREYPMASFFAAGVPVASASDFPVTVPPDPLTGIQVGVMRSLSGETAPGDVLWPEERVTVEQMIESFTIAGARAHGLADETGSIAAGKSADLIVLDANILAAPPEEIGAASVCLTVFRGDEVYRAEGFTA